MAEFEHERELLRAVRDRLDGWIREARERAYGEVFEGDDAVVSDEERRKLDRIDSRLSREEGRGLWQADEYGIVQTGTLDEESTPRVVCTSHPQLPTTAVPGGQTIDEATRAALNDALWEYSQRVVELTQERLEEFVWSADVATWEE